MNDTPTQDTQATGEAQTPSLQMKGQYIKDLSFENPGAPMSLTNISEAPKIDVNVDLNAQRMSDTLFELGLVVNVKANSGDDTLFICDLTYCGVFEMIGIPEDKIQPVLFVDCAFLLFPFARRVMADCTRDGGFPPLLMEPIDFATLFRENAENIKVTGEGA